MYPFVRLVRQFWLFRKSPLPLFGVHVSRHLCLPWDLDPWMELNNGRTLTLYDLGRVPFSGRIGMEAALRANRWGMAVAGAAVRYRRRVHAFQRFEMRTRLLGWDARFLYIDQAMWRGGEAVNHAVLRVAATDRGGILAPARLMAAMGHEGASPDLPGWVQGWSAAEADRPWPPVP